jgi:hypothetical protein
MTKPITMRCTEKAAAKAKTKADAAAAGARTVCPACDLTGMMKKAARDAEAASNGKKTGGNA